MQTIDELSTELNLTTDQVQKIQSYINQLVVELLQSIKEDNDRNFDETISSLQS